MCLFTHNWAQSQSRAFQSSFLRCTCVDCLEVQGCRWEQLCGFEIYLVRMVIPPTTFGGRGCGTFEYVKIETVSNTLWPLMFKSHRKWVSHRSGFNSQRVRRVVYLSTYLFPFSFIFYGFSFNSMLWMALTVWSWFICSSYKYPFLSLMSPWRFSTFPFFCVFH